MLFFGFLSVYFLIYFIMFFFFFNDTATTEIYTLSLHDALPFFATWYLWEGGRILVNMDEGRARLEYVRRDPRVSLTVLDGDDWYRHVSLRGRVASLDD